MNHNETVEMFCEYLESNGLYSLIEKNKKFKKGVDGVVTDIFAVEKKAGTECIFDIKVKRDDLLWGMPCSRFNGFYDKFFYVFTDEKLVLEFLHGMKYHRKRAPERFFGGLYLLHPDGAATLLRDFESKVNLKYL
jgi:hypothetical protein